MKRSMLLAGIAWLGVARLAMPVNGQEKMTVEPTATGD